jgi:hypothetical protein
MLAAFQNIMKLALMVARAFFLFFNSVFFFKKKMSHRSLAVHSLDGKGQPPILLLFKNSSLFILFFQKIKKVMQQVLLLAKALP